MGGLHQLITGITNQRRASITNQRNRMTLLNHLNNFGCLNGAIMFMIGPKLIMTFLLGSAISIFYSVSCAGIAIASNSFFRRSEEHTSELQSRENLVCRLL